MKFNWYTNKEWAFDKQKGLKNLVLLYININSSIYLFSFCRKLIKKKKNLAVKLQAMLIDIKCMP